MPAPGQPEVAALHAEIAELRSEVARLRAGGYGPEAAAVLASCDQGMHPLIARFVATEQPEQCIGLPEDHALQALIAEWPLVPAAWRPPATIPEGLRIGEIWDLLWSTAQVDFADLAARMNVEEDLVVRKFARARAARLIYPDGRVHEIAKGVLRALLAKHVPRGAAGGGGGRRGSSALG